MSQLLQLACLPTLNPARPPSKNRVGGSPRPSSFRAPKTRSQLPESHRVLRPAATTTASGRSVWLSRDPIGEAGGLNLYGMVGNNPVNAVDPLGLDWRMVNDPASGAVGAVYYKGRWFPEMTSEVCFIGGCRVGPETPEWQSNGGIRHVTRSYVEFSSCQKSCSMELGDLHNALRNIPGALESQLLEADAATRTALMRQYLMAAPRSVSGGIGFADGGLLALAVATNPNLSSVIEPGRFRGPIGDAFGVDSRAPSYSRAIEVGRGVGEAGGALLFSAQLASTRLPEFKAPANPNAGCSDFRHPWINPQKQDGHIPGTARYGNRIKIPGKNTSTFFSSQEADDLTLYAWEMGSFVPGTQGVLRIHDFGRPVGLGPNEGGFQTMIRVSRGADGLLHGTPYGPVYQGPLSQ